MDKLGKYRSFIKQLLSKYSDQDLSRNNLDVQLIFDEERDHYQWLNVGWQGSNRIYRCIVHFDIKEDKIWLQQNLTDLNPAEDLVNLGVPKDDIILGLHPPFKRPYTDYGVA